ncbi:MAG: diaminopimelate epimerase [Candidatus Eiseniibacteriota bacterium]
MMRVEFVKMHGAGNDFVVVDRRTFVPLSGEATVASFVRAACDRRTGIGADGVLFLDPANETGLDFAMRYYNRDGGEADLCGNGGRCLAAFAAARGFGSEGRVVFRTPAGRHEARVNGGRVDLVLGDVAPPRLGVTLATPTGGVSGALVRVGVPHFVVPVTDVGAVDLLAFAPVLRGHPDLGPDGANVDIVEPTGRDRARLRTFERGVEGETLACGTGAAASAIALVAAEMLEAPVTLDVASGDRLTVSFERTETLYRAVTLSGPVHVSFEGVFHWDGADRTPSAP